VLPIRVHAPLASRVSLVVFDGDRPGPSRPLVRDGDDWVGAVPEGTVYGLVAHGDGPRFDPSKVLLDPRATDVWFPPGHDRLLAARRGEANAGRSPLAVARVRPPARPSCRSSRPPVVYEVHVDGFTRCAAAATRGTFAALIEDLARLAGLGVTVVELLPVHQSDPQEGSYWGYMPLAFGTVEHGYAAGTAAAAELAELAIAAHELDMELWLDVMFNHTTEIDASGPVYSWRGLADASYYRLGDDGAYLETTGCGNDIDATSPAAQELIVWALDRFADLGIDGFRFDLAAVLSRSEALIKRLDGWAGERGVRLIAEPWDAAGHYQLGPAWPGTGWMQWNDRFRDDMRSFLRGEPGFVPAVRQRLQGSPDLFASPMHSVNFLSCHDGFTLHDVFAYDRSHNAANGHGGSDGADNNRSWNCGWEGEVGAPADVVALRVRQLRNAWCLLALSHGVPMCAAGDEFGRTQGGNNNAYNQDNETSWVDWERRDLFADLERFVRALLALRHRHAILSQPEFWGDAVTWFGVNGRAVDVSTDESSARSLAWTVGDLYVMANAWWEQLEFTIGASGRWTRAVDTARPSPADVIDAGDSESEVVDATYAVGPRSVVVLEREAPARQPVGRRKFVS